MPEKTEVRNTHVITEARQYILQCGLDNDNVTSQKARVVLLGPYVVVKNSC